MAVGGALSADRALATDWCVAQAVRHGAVHIASMTHEDFCRIEIFPGSYLGDRTIRLPPEFVPPPCRYDKFLTLRPEDALLASMGPDSDRAGRVLLEIRRSMLASLWVARRSQNRRQRVPKPTTWVLLCRSLFRLSRWALAEHPDPHTLFAHIDREALLSLAGQSTNMSKIVHDLAKLSRSGALEDWPTSLRYHDPGARPEFAASHGRSGPHKRYQPLPDDFVSELGWRCLWFVEELGPNIVGIFQQLEAIRPLSLNRRLAEGRRIIRDWGWRDTRGRSIDTLPFELDVRPFASRDEPVVARRASDLCQPSHIRKLAKVLQVAHAFIISVSTAPRQSEVLSFDTDSVVPNDEGEATGNGVTYKLSPAFAGSERTWPFHETAVVAFDQQVSLFRGVRSPEAPLFVKPIFGRSASEELSARGTRLTRLNYRSLSDLLCASALLRGTTFHSHRIRKTMVRLIGLALVASPKILMDLLGHKRIRMTLDYMLSDPNFSAEVEAVAKELAALQVEEILTAPETHGGKAGVRFEIFRQERLGRRGEKALGAADMADAIETITAAGQSWFLVRPGIVCTKTPLEAGPCTRSAGVPDPGNCSPECRHRLEDGRYRQDVHECIEHAIGELDDARADGDELQIAFWMGQLRHHLARFGDVRERWQLNPTVIWVREWEERVAARSAT